jgi:hypothetical protein
MGHATISAYIRPGYPRQYATDSASGSTYLYRGTSTTLAANLPAIGDTWADGAPVSAREFYDLSVESGIAELSVTTAIPAVYGGGFTTSAVEETVYESDWRPVAHPLETHPAFRSGGTYELDQTARKHLLGWRAELAPALRSARKYIPLLSDGVPYGAEQTITGNALELIKFLEKGVEEYVEYMPIWRKRSYYRGSSAPGVGSIGQFTATPSGSGYPSGYEWIKSKDSAQRIGRSSRWRRDEEWEGAKIVWADIDEVFPPV